MPRAKKSDVIPELANSLEQWAIRYSLNADPYVVGLLQGMRSKKKIAFWADTRAVDMLPLPEATSGIATKKRLDALLAFRNIMVFVPIAFTWAAISQATTAFAEYAKRGEAKVVNFFDFWENGYGVLSPFWTLSNVARIDFLLLAVIIFVSIGISLSERRLSNLETSEKARLDTERLQIAINIDEALSDYKYPTTQLVNRQLAQSILNLNETARALRAAAKEQESFNRKSANYKELLSELAGIKALISRIK
jgi:hypothetical protein